MRHKFRRGFLALFIIFAVGCGGDQDSGPTDQEQIDQAMTELNDSYLAYWEFFCECYADDTHDGDVDACIEETAGGGIELQECYAKAAHCDAASFNTVYTCFATAYDSRKGCISECPRDENAVAACEAEFDGRKSECGEKASDALDEAFLSCDDGQTPACAE